MQWVTFRGTTHGITAILAGLILFCIAAWGLSELCAQAYTRTIHKPTPHPDLALAWEQGQIAGWYDQVAHTANPRAPTTQNPYTQGH